jgi:hypothetical protein
MFKKRILLFVLALAGAVAALQLTRGTANETPIKPPPYEPATRDKMRMQPLRVMGQLAQPF